MVFRLLSFPWFSTFCFEFCFLYLPKNVIKFLKELSNSCEAAFLQKITWMWCEELALESRKWPCHRFGRQSLDILRHHSWAQRRHQIRTNLNWKKWKSWKVATASALPEKRQRFVVSKNSFNQDLLLCASNRYQIQRNLQIVTNFDFFNRIKKRAGKLSGFTLSNKQK